MPKTKVGIIITTYNSAKYLRSCLYALSKQTWKNFKVIVVDNNSQDDSIRIADNFGAEVICNKENTGFAKATNQGTKALFKQGCTHFLWLNPDANLFPDTLEKLIVGAHNNKADIVQPVIYCKDGKTINTIGNELTYFGVSYCKDYGITHIPKHDQQISFPSGACIMVTRRVLESVRLLDEKFFLYLEDTDFAWRSLMQEFKAYLITNAACTHDYSLKLHGKKMYWLESNRLIMLTQNYSLKTLLLLLPIGILLEIALLLHSVIRGYIHWKLLAYLRFLIKLPSAIQTRKEVRRRFTLSEKDLFKHLAPKFNLEALKIWPVKKIINPLLKNYFILVQHVL